MKFAKELEQDLVPEWRAKYLDYKFGKKKVKAVARAYRGLSQTPRTPGRRRPANLFSSAAHQLPIQSNQSPLVFDDSLADTLWYSQPSEENSKGSLKGKTTSRSLQGFSSLVGLRESSSYFGDTPEDILASERQPLTQDNGDDSLTPWDSGNGTNYGSFVASPPAHSIVPPPMLELPDPAISPTSEAFPRHNRAWRQSRFGPGVSTPHVARSANPLGDAYEVGRRHAPSKRNSSILKPRSLLRSRRTMSTHDDPGHSPRSPFLTRWFSVSSEVPPSPDMALEAYKDFDERQAEFFTFLDKELDKIESFYKLKETEATERLQVLRQQLHEMRDRRLEEYIVSQRTKEALERQQAAKARPAVEQSLAHMKERSVASGLNWIKPIEQAIGAGKQQFDKSTKALKQLGSPPGPVQSPFQGPGHDSWRDFSRRPVYHDEVPYRTAKRKLKMALQEFYRGLELLKSYALLNRTAFRKINKKYDKAVNARPTGRYISEKVSKAWFVQSEVLDGHIVAVEDLYARYFEKGNHKVAVGKLRVKQRGVDHYNASVFRNGLFIAAGFILGIQGIVYGAELLHDPDPVVRLNTHYLLQIYGGYFLTLFLFLLFCIDCSVWMHAKINYVFIFEFDTRHNLDWRQLAELPCFFLCLEGLFMWLNFQQSGANKLFLYWPVMLIGLTLIIMFFPGPVMYHRSREWWATSNFRLLLSPFVPVEFRDFFLGDMYCSQTYAMGNIELFFCLYARGWDDPDQCSSSRSRLLGALSTFPGIWRALQCLRRYYDTRNAFPHLVNCGKYGFTIAYYMSLSMYRIDRSLTIKAFFIACATINSIYTSVWDVAMDWSLLNPFAPHPFLRDVLGYKRAWVYYVAMVLDPILRFNWIFYAIFEKELQHSAILSFVIGLSEVCRRGMWTLFRIENEHCTNVGRFRASRDVPLPYAMPSDETEEHLPEDRDNMQPPPPESTHPAGRSSLRRSHTTSGADLERATLRSSAPSPSTMRRRNRFSTATMPFDSPIQRGMVKMGTAMARAHAQDFERKRRPSTFTSDKGKQKAVPEDFVYSSDEDAADDAEDEQNVADAAGILRRHRSAPGDGAPF